MLKVKTTTAHGGSHAELSKRSIDFLLKPNCHLIKCDSHMAKFEHVFEQMGYLVPTRLWVGRWNLLTPKSNPDLFKPVQVFIHDSLMSIYVFNIYSGALSFYCLDDLYSCASIYEKLGFGGVSC